VSLRVAAIEMATARTKHYYYIPYARRAILNGREDVLRVIVQERKVHKEMSQSELEIRKT
jgi:hypothetical protein